MFLRNRPKRTVRKVLCGVTGTSTFNVRKCLKEINEGRIEDFMLSIKSLLADTNSEREKNKETRVQSF